MPGVSWYYSEQWGMIILTMLFIKPKLFINKLKKQQPAASSFYGRQTLTKLAPGILQQHAPKTNKEK